MRELFIAILSVVFFVIVMPILDSLSNLIQNAVNKKIGKWQIELSKEQKELENNEEETNHSVQAIGFTIPDVQEEEEQW